MIDNHPSSLVFSSNIPSFLDGLSSKRILIIGDVMLDRYVYGNVARISPEAPTQIIDIEGTTASIGAAANCARNITALGAHVTLISVVGDDEAGDEITRQIGMDANIIPYLLVEKGRHSTIKTRYVSGTYQLLRADWEGVSDIAKFMQKRIIELACSEIWKHDVVILSDYDKGVLTPHVIAAIVGAAHGKPVIIDPKKTDWRVYAGATVLTPNLHEWFIANGCSYEKEVASQKSRDCNIKNILVTRSKDGMSLIGEKNADIPAEAARVIDVTGAGDTVVALLALGMASGLSLVESARLANKAAGVVVGKPRTAVVTREELQNAN